MAEDPKIDRKDPNSSKKSPNNLMIVVLGVIFVILLIQNFLDTKMANVSFSYQLEHLINLDLINPAYSRKIATASNLVTFQGRFRDQLSDESKRKFKYLETLDEKNELIERRSQLIQELDEQRTKVTDAGALFVTISGLTIPSGGYQIFDEFFDTSDRQNSIEIKTVQPASFLSFDQVQAQYHQAFSDGGASSLLDDYQVLVRHLRSPLLGIGDDTMKNMLKALDNQLSAKQTLDSLAAATLVKKCSDDIKTVIDKLNQVEDHIRLRQLRSVRSYKDLLDSYFSTIQKLDDNAQRLEKCRQDVANAIWFFNNDEVSSRILEKQDPEVYHQWFVNAQEEWDAFDANKAGYFKAPDQPLNKALEKTFTSEELSPNYVSYLISLAPVLLILFLLYLAFSRQVKGMGGNPMDFGKSPAKLYPKGATKVTFKDVAGIDDALEELEEVVDFLRDPHKFTSLGGRIPKGVLCVGPPGTGKTLIAKAVAGEADCPFFSISGSDFVEMFVGVGASRIRKMFEEAKKNAPCIIFIDEIDAVGRHRGAGVGGGHDEREQTLNQLLVEMDGFDTNEGIIIIAATNRPDVLDKALLRPGRFDRQVVINFPDIKGRFDILKVHAKKIKLDETVDLMNLARSTPGCSGADLQNILNESALLAARRGKIAVSMQEVSESRDKVLYGKERRNLELDAQEKKTTAYHESGHTVVSLLVKHADPVDKVTIIPRGFSLGATQFMPKKNRVSYWKKELLDRLAVLMGGRAAEDIFVGDFSSGAKQDIEQATQLARSMVCEWGMSDQLGAVAYDERSEGGQYLGMSSYKDKTYSERTAESIDSEVKKILDEAYQKAFTLISENRDVVELMTDMLLEFETLDAEDVLNIVERKWNSDDKREKVRKFLGDAAKGSQGPMVDSQESKDVKSENSTTPHFGDQGSADPKPSSSIT